jgi:hypothetical protein
MLDREVLEDQDPHDSAYPSAARAMVGCGRPSKQAAVDGGKAHM